MAGTQRVVFEIHGLPCASCAIDAGRALRRIDGVVDVNINYVVDRGFVEFDPGRTTWATVANALADRGYTVARTR